MDTKRWKLRSVHLDVLLELDPDARASKLESLRAENPELSEDLQRLLALEDSADNFLSEPWGRPDPESCRA